MSQMHEELEIGDDMDRMVRTALTGVAQLVERATRSGAERDRAIAQALREQLLTGRQSPEQSGSSTRPDPSMNVDTSRTDPTSDVTEDGFDARARQYLAQAPAGPDAGRTAAAWEAAMRDVATDPSSPGPADAATQLNRHSRQRHGVDLAATVAATLSDAQANGAASAASVAASAEAAREMSVATAAIVPVVVPAYRDNPDRGVAPTKAATPEEATHRQQAWELARTAWEADPANALPADPVARKAAWDNEPMQTKTDLYWKQYDTEQARTLPAGQGAANSTARPAVAPSETASERGMAPTKAGTAQERSRRESAWALAEQRHTADMPEGTTPAQAQQAWKALEWQERGLRYWTAYDDPELTQASTATTGGETVSRERVIELNTVAADYFTSQATPASKGGQYLEGRLGADVVNDDKWRVGYAPEGWTNLTDHLRGAGATDAEIVDSGLGLRSSRGNVVDAFRDRAVIGIHDNQGQVVGFVGRDLSGSAQAPKYVNTGSTPAYTKGDHVLGLHEAPADARLVRVEGPFDAIATTAAGQGRYAGVAPLGTALTDTQASAIADRANGRVWEALDGDRAGSKATEDDFWVLNAKGVDARMLEMPTGSDPAELWQNNPDRLRGLLNDADTAPTAGVAVINNTLQELGSALRDGESDAHEELAAVHDKVSATLTTDADRDHVSSYTTASVDALLNQADQTRDEAHRLDALDDNAEIAADRSNTPAREDDLEAVADRAVTGREQAAGRAGDLDAEAKAVASAPTGAAAPYDRGAVTPGTAITPEAAQARQASAAGFSRPTRDMLSDAQKRSGTPALPSKPGAQTLGRPRAQRR